MHSMSPELLSGTDSRFKMALTASRCRHHFARGRAERSVRRRADRRAADRGRRRLHHSRPRTSAELHRRERRRQRRGQRGRRHLRRDLCCVAQRHGLVLSLGVASVGVVRGCGRASPGRLDAARRGGAQRRGVRRHYSAELALPRRGARRSSGARALIFRCARSPPPSWSPS